MDGVSSKTFYVTCKTEEEQKRLEEILNRIRSVRKLSSRTGTEQRGQITCKVFDDKIEFVVQAFL